jgi:hypothetical protein
MFDGEIMKKVTHHMLLRVLMGISLLMTFIPLTYAESDFSVEKVVISQNVTKRNPVGIFSPPAYCEKDTSGQAAIPVVKTSKTSQVFLWTKVAATTKGKLRHSWHHQVDGTWRMVSEVNLSIYPSSGYRTWSVKSLNPAIHTGEWMVVIAPSNSPEKILCITRFTVQ